jgi:putative transcriptional regulator
MSELAPGFLVAAPPLGDPNFDRSVVLLAAHGPEGAFGWVVNGRQLMTVSELLVRAEVSRDDLALPGQVRVGGPVSQEQIWLVYPSEDRFEDVEGQFEVGERVTACASRKVLELLAKGVRSPSIVGYAGYAGWAPEQLEREIRAGAWLPTDLEASLIFDAPADEVWRRAYECIGTTPMAFATRTVGSA